MRARFPFPGAVEVIGHRGFSARAPENTVAALELAIDAGADAVEFDLHAAADGTPYLFHDDMLDRTTDGAGPFEACPAERLHTLDAGSWFSDRFSGEPVPTLALALERVSGRIGRVYAEIKRYRTPEDVDRMVEVVSGAGMLPDTVFISMDWTALGRVRSHGTEIGVGYIVEKVARARDATRRAAEDAHAMVDYDARILLAFPDLAREARDASVELATWTVNEVGEAARLLELGIRRITTNEVETMVDWKRAL